MTAHAKPTVTLTLDMQHAVFESLREKRRGFKELAQELDNPNLPAAKLVTLCQRTNTVILREEWEGMQDAIARLTVRSRERQQPDESGLKFPESSYESNLSRTRKAIRQRQYRAAAKQHSEQASAITPT